MSEGKRLLIVGGGFAGSSAALSAARQRHQLGKENDLQITLFNASPCLGIRPRYYEYELEQTQVPLEDFLLPINVNLIVGKVVAVDMKSRQLNYIADGGSSWISYDSLLLAAGSNLLNPEIPGIENCFNIDSYTAAKQFGRSLESGVLATLDHQIESGQTQYRQKLRVAILGGGITGLELACELPITVRKICQKFGLPECAVEISLLDRGKVVEKLGAECRPHITAALQEANICCLDHVSITKIKTACVIYNDCYELQVDLVVSTLGLCANGLAHTLGLPQDSMGRICVDSYMAIVDNPYIFAAGDISSTLVDDEHHSIMSCQQARPQGNCAGYNAVSVLYSEPLLKYSQPDYVTCVDLGDYGAVYTEGWNRKVKAFGVEAKKIKQRINCERIYPPKPSEVLREVR